MDLENIKDINEVNFRQQEPPGVEAMKEKIFKILFPYANTKRASDDEMVEQICQLKKKVKLPKIKRDANVLYEQGWDSCLQQVRESLLKQGIEVQE